MVGAEVSLGQALATRYIADGLPPDGGASRAWFRIQIGPLSLWLPNPPARKRAVFFHDATHVLTGYDTVFSRGEIEIAGYEVASGCGRFWIAWLINLEMFALGLFIRPRSLFFAFVRGGRAASMYLRPETQAELSGRSLTDLRTLIALDQNTERPGVRERLRFGMWSAIAVTAILAPAAAVAGTMRLLRGIRSGVHGLRLTETTRHN